MSPGSLAWALDRRLIRLAWDARPPVSQCRSQSEPRSVGGWRSTHWPIDSQPPL
ncbi:hypothetical protein DAEQUDRAFT_728796 [Daedalea quercina L-15889]|uniref:Uncharacterized protein n=1 Tax=Daedalea quercina L-15889 TaxID=1314783 RepID=A0A165P5U0_9APHY|nr:hypothetical protein DAEQUDRAFT_728796 [Daedalea quercina L-15889]